ncbi:SH3 domain-containing protein [Streptomyces sp. NPDC058439]|uniref:SH3 domain-containing protein n=1 Tax=Streptomyces sp. NPDC058439 TaxID=3346500 RepID=UPI0036668AE5
MDPTTKSGLILLGRYVTASQIRRAGTIRIAGHLGWHGVSEQTLAQAAVNSARAHHVALPGELRTAELIRALADELVAGKARLKALEDEIEQLVTAHPDGALIRSLPGIALVPSGGTSQFLPETRGTESLSEGQETLSDTGSRSADPEDTLIGEPMNRTIQRSLVAAIAAIAVLPAAVVSADTAAAAQQRPAAPHQQMPHRRTAPPQLWEPSHSTSRPCAGYVQGRVVTRHMPLRIRSGPGTGYRVIGSLRPGSTVHISCKKTVHIPCKKYGSNVRGNHRWYKLSHNKGYISARYVRNVSAVPWC